MDGHATRGSCGSGTLGCGSHSFRNIIPAYHFAPVDLVATCDLDRSRAEAFAADLGADRAYGDLDELLADDEVEAVFIVTNCDERGRPRYPELAVRCLEAGRHVWIEKPPAASCDEIEAMMAAAESAGRQVGVGLKKMFFPANQKAKELISRPEFGPVSLATFVYPQAIPTRDEFARYLDLEEPVGAVVGFLDHLCHPVSLMIYLLGPPKSLHFERSTAGAGAATFTFASGAVATLALTNGASSNGGMERTTVVSSRGLDVVVDNNIRVHYRRTPVRGYGDVPSYFGGEPGETSASWEPEFSLGQLYNKGLFLLGYYNEIAEFATAVLEDRALENGTLEQAWQVTAVFEAFAQGPGETITIPQLASFA